MGASPRSCRTRRATRRLHSRATPEGLNGYGMSGCASILGAAGQEFGLNLALGAEGFSLHEQLTSGELDNSVLRVRMDSLLFSICNATPASREHARLVPHMLETRKVKSPVRGYLTAMRLLPARDPRVPGADEGLFLARCLEAVAELTETGRLGTDAPRQGELRLFFELTETSGALTIGSSYREVASVSLDHEPVELPETLVARIRPRPRTSERYLLSVFTPPGSIRGAAFWGAMLMDDHRQILLLDAAEDFAAAARLVFQAFAGLNETGERNIPVPHQVWTDSRQVLKALSPALRQVGVQLVQVEEIPEIEDAMRSLGDFMRRGGR